ncbi:copper amine oxidase N-terminal domain-containing protein [Heliophilum fasciatum]|uniref:Copper amine oxidase-like protein n=1 Tax=Heliophilum fasciatum TaxID=35700 RepID=A0A4R2RRY0_9FIRM|nr:copper amine oxidase N-terminal domain-containing protein [Heliophilum fasciatum]MCW2277452.1 hypothetical protein [Heliophilum fasciatum]TCP65257.1 copper amine oxidase-like protein [Heliophilum fasciatum]
MLKNKIAAIVLSSAVALSLALPALAATYNVNSVRLIDSSGTLTGVRIVVTVPPDTLTSQDKLRFTLPTDLRMTSSNVNLSVPTVGSGLANQFRAATVTNSNFNGAGSGNDFVEVTVSAYATEPLPDGLSAIGEGRLIVDFPDMKANGLPSGDVRIKAEAASNSVFTNTAITVGTVGSGSVSVSVDDVKTITSSGNERLDTIYFKEDRTGALKPDGTSIKLKLPSGFTWESTGTLQSVWGSTPAEMGMTISEGSDDRELIINATSASQNAAYFTLIGATISVDESIAKKGDIVVNISGSTTTTPSSFTIAKYGDYSTNVTSYGDIPTISAGKNGDTISQIGAFKIEEEVPGSLIPNRTITLTLPEGARWGLEGEPLQLPTRSGESKDGGLNEFTWSVVDREDANRILKATIGGSESTSAARLIYEKAQIATAADFSGDLAVEVGGTAGINGKIVLAKVTPVATVSVSEVRSIALGLGDQPIGDILITEGTKEAFNKDQSELGSEVEAPNDATVNLQLPIGVFFSGTPTVEVVSGDLLIESGSVTTNLNGSDGTQGSLRFNIRSSSTTPSTIKVSNIRLTTNRTVPEGDIVLKVRGSAVNKSGFMGRGTAASAVIGRLITAAPSEVRLESSFQINSTRYTSSGVEKTMDVAPYIKDGRTYLPVRYVAEALGVPSDNIIYDPDSGTVTLIKGSLVAQMTIGKKELKLNGAIIPMEVPTELVAGRTMLPVAYVARVLGTAITYDEATKTVTIK